MSEIVRLGDIVAITAPQVDPREPAFRDLALVNGENVVSGECRLAFRRTAAEEAVVSPKYLFDTGDVLYSKLRPYLRDAVVADALDSSTHMYHPLVTRLDSRWLAWMLVAHRFTDYAARSSDEHECRSSIGLNGLPLRAQRRIPPDSATCPRT